ncbi:hypothetical protein CLIB1444_14S01860 [[Candida] jaroonii]|uniref:Uncharacterized protein n=1 Tax=[Candida] jaroonii TaxID=467808 RepID=A0ACA9YE35_9ASCO|nr:hypothetical protein CLIB1444_14S01860 [[Candida] jaroonii]
MDVKHLRLSIIGNKDVKYKLHNEESLNGLIPSIDDVELFDKLNILKFLLKFESVSSDLNDKILTLIVEIVDKWMAEYLGAGTEDFKFTTYEGNGDYRKLISLSIEILELLKTRSSSTLNDLLVLLLLEEDELLLKLLEANIEISDITVKLMIKRLKFEIQRQNYKLIYRLIVKLNDNINEDMITRLGITFEQPYIIALNSIIENNANEGNNIFNLNILNFYQIFNIQINLNKLIELINFNSKSINSFKIISSKILNDESIITDLKKIKIDVFILKYLSTFNSEFNLNHFLTINFKDFLLLVSLLTSNDEEFRLIFINQKGFNFKKLVSFFLNTYKSILKGFVKMLCQSPKDVQKVIGLIGDEIFTNCFYLIRSLSRSIELLRTFFIECDLIDNLIEILQLLELIKFKDTNKIIIMNIIANLILDFSSFRYNLINNELFFKVIMKIFNQNHNNEIKLSILIIIKNLLYNENEDNKINLINEYFHMDLFLPFLNYNTIEDDHQIKLKQKSICFDILRNLSSNSNHFNNYLPKIVSKELNMSWDNFLISNIENVELFGESSFGDKEKLISNDDYVNLVLSINYIENHLFLSNGNNHLNVKILKIWLEFLKVKSTSVNNYSIKLSIIWILINLTWKNSFSIKLFDTIENLDNMNFIPPANTEGHVNDDNYNQVKIVMLLKELGFIDVLKQLVNNEVDDLVEKIKTILFHFENILNHHESDKGETEPQPIQPASDSDYNTSDDDYWVR